MGIFLKYAVESVAAKMSMNFRGSTVQSTAVQYRQISQNRSKFSQNVFFYVFSFAGHKCCKILSFVKTGAMQTFAAGQSQFFIKKIGLF